MHLNNLSEKLYVMFLQSVVVTFNSFNTFPQSEEQIIDILYHSNLRLYRSLLSRFILPEVILELDDMLSTDLEDPDVLKDFNSIFSGEMTKQRARDIIGTSEYKNSWKKVELSSLKVQSTCKH